MFGKNTLMPYMLDRKIKTLDYVIISHFDTDHVGGVLYIMENMKIKNIIIGKQFETSENLQKFLDIVQKQKINLIVVQAGNIINIENNFYFNVLWPEPSKQITENSVNNNALVCKMVCNNFSMLFTGDIEEQAEKELVSKYKSTNILESTVLKIAHHGSKSSSTEEFLDLVKPKIALIGVGKNNNYGHPNEEVLNRLNAIRCKNL